MSTSAVTETCFTSTFVDRAAFIFLRPDPRYTWDNIVTGVIVRSEDGSKRTFSAAAGNTFRGFVRINKKCPGAQKCFRQYFLDEKENLIEQLSRLETREELHQLENRIRTAIRARIDNVALKEAEDESYNKFRMPVDLYIMNLVAMASELDA